jgi:hypothetical protein
MPPRRSRPREREHPSGLSRQDPSSNKPSPPSSTGEQSRSSPPPTSGGSTPQQSPEDPAFSMSVEYGPLTTKTNGSSPRSVNTPKTPQEQQQDPGSREVMYLPSMPTSPNYFDPLDEEEEDQPEPTLPQVVKEKPKRVRFAPTPSPQALMTMPLIPKGRQQTIQKKKLGAAAQADSMHSHQDPSSMSPQQPHTLQVGPKPALRAPPTMQKKKQLPTPFPRSGPEPSLEEMASSVRMWSTKQRRSRGTVPSGRRGPNTRADQSTTSTPAPLGLPASGQSSNGFAVPHLPCSITWTSRQSPSYGLTTLTSHPQPATTANPLTRQAVPATFPTPSQPAPRSPLPRSLLPCRRLRQTEPRTTEAWRVVDPLETPVMGDGGS